MLAALRQLLGLLDDLFLLAVAAELSNDAPAPRRSRRELHDGLGEERDVLLGPVVVFNDMSLLSLLFLFLRLFLRNLFCIRLT